MHPRGFFFFGTMPEPVNRFEFKDSHICSGHSRDTPLAWIKGSGREKAKSTNHKMVRGKEHLLPAHHMMGDGQETTKVYFVSPTPIVNRYFLLVVEIVFFGSIFFRKKIEYKKVCSVAPALHPRGAWCSCGTHFFWKYFCFFFRICVI